MMISGGGETTMEESGGASPLVQQGRTVIYEKRCWGPAAVVALAMVVLLNGAVLRNNTVPAAASSSTDRRAWQGIVLTSMADDRLLVAVEHQFGGDREESGLVQEIGRAGGGGFDIRHTGEEDEPSVVLQYTRRRYRYLGGEYTHQDTSADFSRFGRISTSLIYLVFWVSLMFPDTLLPIGRPGIALGGGLVMIVWRYFLVL
jgi:hypothetical protein